MAVPADVITDPSDPLETFLDLTSYFNADDPKAIIEEMARLFPNLSLEQKNEIVRQNQGEGEYQEIAKNLRIAAQGDGSRRDRIARQVLAAQESRQQKLHAFMNQLFGDDWESNNHHDSDTVVPRAFGGPQVTDEQKAQMKQFAKSMEGLDYTEKGNHPYFIFAYDYML